MSSPFAVPAFRRWIALRSCTMTASQVQLAAIGWAVYAATGDALDLAWVGLAQFLPVLLLVLPAGHVADRFDRRVILATCYLAQAGIGCGFATAVALGDVGPVVIFALGLSMGTVRAFGNPAGQALLPALVPIEALGRAVAVSSTLWQLATIAGPSLAGIVIAWGGGPVSALVLSAVLQLVSVGVVSTLPRPRVEARAPTWDNVLAGIRYVRDHRLLLACTSLDLFAVLLGGATALLPIYATEVLRVGATGYGALRSAPAIGAAIVAIFLGIHPLDRRAGPVILGAVALFGTATVAFGVSKSFPLSLLALAVLGASDMVSVVIRQTLVQLRTPDEMRGRVAAVNQVFIGASNELGEFESGLTARWFGAVPAVVAGGIGTLLVVMAWGAGFPELRRADRLVP